MRNYIVLILMFLAFSAQSQMIAPTTDEEYNYGAIGYKIQLQNRLDTKEGYYLKDAEGCEEAERKMEFKLIYRNGETQPCAVIAIFTKIRTAPLYFCIPSANASQVLWDKFYKSLTSGTDNPAGQLQFTNLCLARLMMEFAGGKL